jgi:acetylglutamate kinase
MLVLLKYGGNAMVSEDVQQQVAESLRRLRDRGVSVVVVHGGGPFIAKMLDLVDIESEFIEGHRKTTPEALKYVEIALKGEVNGALVGLFNRAGLRAVGLSGKDGRMVIATKRRQVFDRDGRAIECDLGQVGDVDRIDTTLVTNLVDGGYLPVVTCIATGDDGLDYNVNADMFAGHLAGALSCDSYVVLTDVDGVMRDVDDPDSRIESLAVEDLDRLSRDVVQGGMIPKLESCRIAIQGGARRACIVNGTKPDTILQAALGDEFNGTLIHG